MKNKYLRKALQVATDILPKIPTRQDNLFSVIVKVIAIIDSVTRLATPSQNTIYSFFDTLDASVTTNSQFVDLFFSTPVHEMFEMESFEIDDYRSVQIAHKDGIGTLYFVEHRWGAKPEYGDEFWVSPGFRFDLVLNGLWDFFHGQIHIEVRPDERQGKTRTFFSEMPSITDPIIGKNAELLERIKKRHARFMEQEEPCTYLFLGKQGAGKTTMAQRYAHACGNRCIRIDAGGLTTVGVQDLDFLLKQLKPSFLLVDDIDKCATIALVLPTLLSLLSDLRAKHPKLTVILTAATAVGLDPALVRPRRIDKIIEFELPDVGEREQILSEYGVSQLHLIKLARATKGLTAAYLQGIAAQLRCGDPLTEVLSDIKRMKKLDTTASGPPLKVKGAVMNKPVATLSG